MLVAAVLGVAAEGIARPLRRAEDEVCAAADVIVVLLLVGFQDHAVAIDQRLGVHHARLGAADRAIIPGDRRRFDDGQCRGIDARASGRVGDDECEHIRRDGPGFERGQGRIGCR